MSCDGIYRYTTERTIKPATYDAWNCRKIRNSAFWCNFSNL